MRKSLLLAFASALILFVTGCREHTPDDNGNPALTRYARVILNI